MNLRAYPFLGEVSYLKSLILNNNEISKLPDSITKLDGLEELDVFSNQFEEFQKLIFHLTKIKILNCGYNFFRYC
jgi:Leucine-rich repeat (LRR) protein